MKATPYEEPPDLFPCQGSLYRDIYFAVPPEEGPEDGGLDTALYPYAVVLSQQCDLERDASAREMDEDELQPDDILKRADGMLPSVLLCPAYPSQAFRAGTHLSESLGIKVPDKNSDAFSLIRQNRDPRYHYLCSWPALQVQETVVDFKHFFTLPTETLVAAYGDRSHYIAQLTCPYREDISHRFTAFLARIGLPETHKRLEAALKDAQ